MGILNITPDSFSDGGNYLKLEAAKAQVEKMLAEGADIIDIGGESTRPGSDPVSSDEQINRIVPVVQAIRQYVSKDIPISIDTTLSSVAEACLNAGASMINDISAGSHDQSILSLAVEFSVPIVLMHMQGNPKTMQDNPFYQDVVKEVVQMLEQKVQDALAYGVKADQIILDPGIGFGKRVEDNLNLLAGLDQIVEMGFPVLLGTSRKRFMGKICGQSQPNELVTATAVTTGLGIMQGASIFRVHDVLANRQAADLAWAIKQSEYSE